ncbi:MAG: hypothetical protein B9S37_12585 [Verrucomicrobiia bacterium Tous-C3TDCM]|nr:MAG: hypothetical protein B9S37_12585 [Verrucomicrobiae bacterium Tous-C3TDCM]
MQRWLKRLFCCLAAVFLIITIGIAWIGSKQTLSPKRRSIESYHQVILDQPAHYGLSISSFIASEGTPCMVCEPVAPTSADQTIAHKSRLLRHELTLRNAPLARWGQIRGTIFMLHGHRGCKEDHLPICERFCAAGFRCLLIDIPGHGSSPHPYATFGYRESEMIPAIWQEYQDSHGLSNSPLFLFGYSQGGAISLLTAAKYPQKICAIASISAFSSLENPIAASAKHLPPVIRQLTPLTTRACALGIYLRAGFFPSAVQPSRAASMISCPVFLSHGLDDSFVSADQAQQIYHAIPGNQKNLKLIPAAKHHNTLSTGSTALYADICEHFLHAL